MPAMRRKDRNGPGMSTVSPDAAGGTPPPGASPGVRTDKDKASVGGTLGAAADKQDPVQRRPPAIRLRERRGKTIANTPQMYCSLNRISQLPAPTGCASCGCPPKATMRPGLRLGRFPLISLSPADLSGKIKG